MTLLEFLNTVILGMAGWAFFILAVSLVVTVLKRYQLSRLKDLTSALSFLGDKVRSQTDKLESERDERMEETERRAPKGSESREKQ